MLMSEIQQIQSDYIGSERSATEALAYININTDKSYISSFYNILGNNYDNTFDFELAKKNYNLAIENAINDDEKIMFQNNIAVVLIDDSEFDQALEMLKTLKENPKTETNKVIYAKILGNIGYCLLKTKKTESLDYFTKELALKQKIKDDYGLISFYMHLSEYYDGRDKKQQLQYAQMALTQAEKLDCPNERLKTMEILLPSKPLVFSQKYFEANDSLKNFGKLLKISMQKYDLIPRKFLKKIWYCKIRKLKIV